MEIRVYTPRRQHNLSKLLGEIIRGFMEGRDLAWRLFVRDLKASYRKSYLGILWLFLPSLATAMIWIFLNSQKVVAINNAPMAYAGFAVCGSILWSLFSESIIKPIARYQSAMGMMAKLNFPREAIILASVYDLIFSCFLKLIILIPLLWILGYPPTLAFIPAILAIFALLFTGLSIGVFLSPVGLLYNDIGKGLPVVLPILMYLTPVIYPARKAGYLAIFQQVNPVTPFLERARSLVGHYEFTMNTELLIWSLVVVVMFVVGLFTLRVSLPIIVERTGS